MLQLLAGKDAGEGKGAVRFERHRPEQTLLYWLVEQYYPDLEMQWASEGRALPDYLRLRCGLISPDTPLGRPLTETPPFCPHFTARTRQVGHFGDIWLESHT